MELIPDSGPAAGPTRTRSASLACGRTNVPEAETEFGHGQEELSTTDEARSCGDSELRTWAGSRTLVRQRHNASELPFYRLQPGRLEKEKQYRQSWTPPHRDQK